MLKLHRSIGLALFLALGQTAFSQTTLAQTNGQSGTIPYPGTIQSLPVAAPANIPTPQISPQSPLPNFPQTESLIFVAPNGIDDPGSGSAITPFRTITAALRTLPGPGTIIQLATGNYSAETGEEFPLKLLPGIKLRGNADSKGEGISIKGGGFFVSPTFARQNIAMLAANNAQVIGVTITNSGSRGYGLWVESSKNFTATSSTFINNTHDGVFLTGDSIANVVSSQFTKNRGSGISAVGSSSGDIRGNVFDNTGFGLSIGQKSSVVVSSNQIINNRNGIILSNIATPSLHANTIANSQEYGLVILRDRSGNQPNPDLGTQANPGLNIFKGNKKKDINNTTGAKLLAVGNQIDNKRVSGPMELIGSVAPPSTPVKPPAKPPAKPPKPSQVKPAAKKPTQAKPPAKKPIQTKPVPKPKIRSSD